MGSKGVNYPTEYMQTLASSRQKKWTADASAGRAKIKDNSLRLEHFGDLAPLQSFGHVYMAARQVYLDTLKGVDEDLEAAAAGIVSSAKQMKDRDDQAGEAFITLRSRWEKGLASSAQQTAASRTEQVRAADETQADARQELPADGSAGTADAVTPVAGASAPPAGDGLTTPTIS
jgi:hypothetical protein